MLCPRQHTLRRKAGLCQWWLWISTANALCGSACYKHRGLCARMAGVVLRGNGIETGSQLEPLWLLLHATDRVRFEAEALSHLDVARLQCLQRGG